MSISTTFPSSAAPTALLLLLQTATLAATAPPETPGGRLAERTLQLSRAVGVADLELGSGSVAMRLARGTLVPVAPVGDRPAEFVFVGDGLLRATPPDDVERGQLELFTGGPALEAAFGAAILVVGGEDTAVSLLAGREAARPPDEVVERAQRLFRDWRASPEIRAFHAEGALLRETVGDPAMERYFLAWIRETRYGDIVYNVDPDEIEQLELARFVPGDRTPGGEESGLREIDVQHRRDRRIGLRIGGLDTWLSESLRDAASDPAPGHRPFEPRHYTLTIEMGDDGRIQGGARLDLVAVDDGGRGLSLDLRSDLEVRQVLDGAGTPLAFHREGSDLTVALAGPVPRGEEVSLLVAYAGDPVGRPGARSRSTGSPAVWYPRAGTLDRATYDVTLRYPAKYDVLTSGRREGSGEEADGTRWIRLVQETPVHHFGFELGDFDVARDSLGDVKITVAFHRGPGLPPKSVQKEIRKTVRDTLDAFQRLYGPYPLDRLTVVTVPRSSSQSSLGFIALSDRAMSDSGGWPSLLGMSDRRLLLAHVIAHQWWGGLVGWKSYRDQWLTEAVASYSAGLYASHPAPPTGWRSRLLATTADGRTLESLGPVTLGRRLDSSPYPDAYDAIYHLKGAMALGMLARLFHEDEFPEMLNEVVRLASGLRVATADFLGSLAALSGHDLDWFGDRYFYGTGLPEVEYSYELVPRDEGGWWVRGEARQLATYRFRYRVVRTGQGGHDVRRDRLDMLMAAPPHLEVPFQVLLGPRRRGGSEEEVSGSLLLRGDRTPIRIQVDRTPVRFWLDREEETLATFSCGNREPKRVGLRTARDLAAGGDPEAAEAAFRAALESPVTAEGRVLDALIHLGLADLYLDQDRDADAREELDRDRELLAPDELAVHWQRLANLESRLDIRAGEYEAAFERLRGRVTGSERSRNTETLLLLAIAARETGRAEDLAWARRQAELQGADVALLPAGTPGP